ncbi:alpha-L-iduronidase-like isoform X2 [Saccostrea cucullata]|uniref:alpha-L-iduronidase-like isoform X2 n=1 Tax=Saccostrea cuccullata TaxID=36930 RepID=UPI002ED5A18A
MSSPVNGIRRKSNSESESMDLVNDKMVTFNLGENFTDESDGGSQVNGVKRRNARFSRTRRTKSLYGVMPNCKFGPCGSILDDSATSLSCDDCYQVQGIEEAGDHQLIYPPTMDGQPKTLRMSSFPGKSFLVVCNLFALISLVTSVEYNLDVDTKDIRNDLTHFWKSTGFSPPLPHKDAYKFDFSKDMQLNMALIGSLPHSGIKQVRIHWLLELVTVKQTNGNVTYDFSKLDDVIGWLWTYGLKPGFELMGNPSGIFTDFDNSTQVDMWKDMITQLASNYIDQFGLSEVMDWNFETWNEPDCHDFDNIKFSVQGFLNYYDACSEGLLAASPLLKFGGPGDGCDGPGNTKFSDAVLSHVVNGTNFFTGKKGNRIDFLSYHRKGDGSSAKIYQYELKTVSDIQKRYPFLTMVPFFNDEADPMVGWNKDLAWRADSTYAAMVAKVIAQHQNMILAKLPAFMNYSLLSNDNAFLSYVPHQFTQRTLAARFQMNNTATPFVQLVLKPIYTVMAALSLLGDKQVHVNLTASGEFGNTVVLNDSNVGALASVHVPYKGIPTSDAWQLAVLIYSSNDTSSLKRTDSITVSLNLDGPGDFGIVEYYIDNTVTNPYAVWETQGKPSFPSVQQFREMRSQEGLMSSPVKYFHKKKDGHIYRHKYSQLIQPGVILIHACAKSKLPPDQVTSVVVHNITVGQVLTTWSDHCVNTKCILYYDVEFSSKSQSGPYTKINNNTSIITAFNYVPDVKVLTDDLVAGFYRIRAVDYFLRPGAYSLPVQYPNKTYKTTPK